jgi:hypothetical protein
MPSIDTSVDIYDRAAVIESKDAFFREQLVRHKEIQHLREKMKWCYRREGVNHLQNCKELSTQYMDLMKEFKEGGWFKGYTLPT